MQSGRILLKLRQDFQHHVILIQLCEQGRDLALAESIVERVVDHLGRDAQPGSGIAIDDQRRLQTRCSAGRWRRRAVPAASCSFSTNCGAQMLNSFASGSSKRVLILRAADAIFDGQVLHRLHVQRDALDLGQLRLQAADHVTGADLALLQRLQIDLNAPAVQRGVGAINADERRKTLDRRVLAESLAPMPAAARPWLETKWSAAPRKCPESRRYPAPGKNLSAR